MLWILTITNVDPETDNPTFPQFRSLLVSLPASTGRAGADGLDSVHASGLAGGKGVSESGATHPCVFATFTAPSFGPAHTRITAGRGRGLPNAGHGGRPATGRTGGVRPAACGTKMRPAACGTKR